jgi:hypothetical protein
MNVCKRVLGVVALLLGAAGLLLRLAVGIGVWVVKEPVTARARHISGRVDAALDLAEQKLDHARTTLANAAERLENVKEERRQLPREARRGGFAQMALARTVQRTLAPELNDAHKDPHTVAEAADATLPATGEKREQQRTEPVGGLAQLRRRVRKRPQGPRVTSRPCPRGGWDVLE